MPPMATAKCTEQGHVTDPLLDYYREKTAGGYFSMVITEHCFVSPEGMAHDRQLSIADDSTIEGLSRLVAVIHENGSKAIAQISHAGSEAKGSGLPTCSASMVSFGKHCAADHAMTADEIHTLVQKFALAAKRAKDAGYDGIELHSAHTYLLDQFYSPLSNHRTDEYGGSISNRIRIHLEIIRAVKTGRRGLSHPAPSRCSGLPGRRKYDGRCHLAAKPLRKPESPFLTYPAA